MISFAVGMLQKPERIRLAVRQLGATSSWRHLAHLDTREVPRRSVHTGGQSDLVGDLRFPREAMQVGARAGVVHCNSALNP